MWSKTFTKSNLRAGMVTKLRNGVKSIILIDATYFEETQKVELLLVSKELGVIDINNYNNKLNHSTDNNYDIVEIRKFNDNDDMFEKYDLDNDYDKLELIWRREE